MLVREVVALAAETLGREDLSEELSALEGEPEGEIKSLLRCYNLIENEVALDFFPLKETERFTPEDGKISYRKFTYAPVDIHRVTDTDGVPLRFEILPAYLTVSRKGAVDVTYAYSPPPKTLDEETAFREKISARLLAFGVASEYCITNRNFTEGRMWGGRYRDALRAAGIYRRTLSVRSRRWI